MIDFTFRSESAHETKYIALAIQKHFPKIKIHLIDKQITPIIKLEFKNESERDEFLGEFTNILGVNKKGAYSRPDWYQIINQPQLA